jgi:hypothetical protein
MLHCIALQKILLDCIKKSFVASIKVLLPPTLCGYIFPLKLSVGITYCARGPKVKELGQPTRRAFMMSPLQFRYKVHMHLTLYRKNMNYFDTSKKKEMQKNEPN